MKKKNTFCMLLSMIIVVLCSVVYATETFTMELQANKNTLKPGEELEIILSMGGFTEEGNGIGAVLANLEYDRTIFDRIEKENITVLKYWEEPTFNPENGSLLIDSYTFVNEPHEAVKIKLKVKDKIKETTTTEIKLTNIVGTDGDHDIEVADATTTVNIEKSRLFFGSNSQDNSNLFYIIAGVAVLVILVGVIVIFVTKKSKEDKENSDK